MGLMTTNHALVLLFTDDSDFIEHAAYQLKALGLQMVPVLTQDELLRTIRDERPALVLVHWDTLGESALRFCSFLKASLLRRAAPVAIVREGRGGGRFVTGALASGADDVIEDAREPRLFAARLRALLRWAPPLAAELGNPATP
jgi:DNA-binding response OmpR family regulator